MGQLRLSIGLVLIAARNRGCHRIYMNCLATNRAMQQLARKFTKDLTFEMGDIVHLDRVLNAVRRVDAVYDVYRVTSS